MLRNLRQRGGVFFRRVQEAQSQQARHAAG
jgi:hypothetical protein